MADDLLPDGGSPPGGPEPDARTPRRFLIAAVVLVVVAIGAVVVARSVDPSRLSGTKVDPTKLAVGKAAPGLTGARGWLNSAPLGPGDLAGKVVVYDFWTYSCVNCIRTLPYVRSWYDRYGRDGLVVVGVHSPEFDFEKVHANVQKAVTRLAVTWPVALDDDMAIWDRFDNHYWPAKYVTDRQGRLRYTHSGEGEYGVTEDVIRNLLGVDPASPRAGAANGPAEDDTATGTTRETYLGVERGSADAQAGPATYPEPGAISRHEVRLVGEWVADAQSVEARAPGAAVVLSYRAKEVNLVFNPPVGPAGPAGPGSEAVTGPVDVVVTLDGEPLPAADRTPDTVVEADGTTLVRVDRSDLFRLVVTPSSDDHLLRLTATSPGVRAFAFTFG